MGFQYRIYGLNVKSSRSINLLSEQVHYDPDLEVIWTNDPKDTPDLDLQWTLNIKDETDAINKKLHWISNTVNGIYHKIRFFTEKYHLDFILDTSKKKLWIIHDKHEIESNLDSYFVGPGLGCVLRLRETVCLHASAVNINEKAVIFLGYKRSGKSTTAAAFSKLGYKILADDIAAITPLNSVFFVQPGYPKIRLRPTSMAKLLEQKEAESLNKVYTHQTSRYLSLEEEKKFSAEALPLAAIYILGCINTGDPTPFLESIKAQEKLIKLTENILGRYTLNIDLRKKEFFTLSELTKKIHIKRLMFGHDLETLPLQCRIIIEDVQQLK